VDLGSVKRRKLDHLSEQMTSLVGTLKQETESKLSQVSEELKMSLDPICQRYEAA
jgi:hypothetical protein